ncbi:EF-hand domain-containing protein [Leisingera sp.]|uniref:EF-hand domain-containing protein n=1 Tax=Leisingera sp. TaxID=1879318 RepID=UPI003A947288
MKTFALTAAALTALAAAPVAALDLNTGFSVGIGAEADVDGNGTFSMEELQAAYPELDAETFAAIDANADGEADEEEVQAAVNAGVLAKSG